MIRNVLIVTLILPGLAFFPSAVVCWADEPNGFEKARQDVNSFLAAGNYEQAKMKIDKLAADFPKHKDLPEALYWSMQNFEWSNRFEQTKEVYKRIIQMYPDHPAAGKAKMGLARVEVASLVMSQKFDQAKEATEKMSADFAGNPDLPETLYWVAERYKWLSRFDDEKQIYQQIAKNYPNSTYTSKAQLGIARSDVMTLVMSQNYDRAREALGKMVTDFAGNPDLPEALSMIAERYEWLSKYEQAKSIYLRIAQSYPQSPIAGKAKLRSAMADVMALIVTENYNWADQTLDKMVTDFNQNPDLPNVVLLVGEKYYKERKSVDSLGRAKAAFKIITEKLPPSSVTPEACSWVGDSCTEAGQYGEAIKYYTRACDGYPQFGCGPGSLTDYDFRWRSLFMIAQSYQKLNQSGMLSNDKAEPLMRAAYERLLKDFGKCGLVKDTWRELGKLNAKNEQWSETARCLEAYLKIVSEERCSPDVFYDLGNAYDKMGEVDTAKKKYTMFLKSAIPTDPRRKEVKARLAELEKVN